MCWMPALQSRKSARSFFRAAKRPNIKDQPRGLIRRNFPNLFRFMARVRCLTLSVLQESAGVEGIGLRGLMLQVNKVYNDCTAPVYLHLITYAIQIKNVALENCPNYPVLGNPPPPPKQHIHGTILEEWIVGSLHNSHVIHFGKRDRTFDAKVLG